MTENVLPPLVDSHCHIDFADFDSDLKETVTRATKAGVSKILTICTKPTNTERVLEITARYPNIFFAAGSHPLNKFEDESFTYKEISILSSHPKMVGIGETGLDYFYSAQNADLQKKHFRMHIELARECSLPLIVHSRSADSDMAKILMEEYNNGPFTCVLHCFSSGRELANTAIDLDFYFSASGIVAFPKSNALREIFSIVPLDRILVETDSPYLAPPPFRGKRNEPSYVTLTAKVLAAHLDISEGAFRRHTTNNFNRLFKKTEN